MSAILEVAEGLRWSDPQLAVALAEHVARAAGQDPGARSAAERSAVLALGQSDRAAELVVRALPHLREAEREGRATDAAVLRCEVARAAVACGDVDAAEALLEPLAGGRVLPPTARVDALAAWAVARAARGDVVGVDAASRQIEELVGESAGDGRRLAGQRARVRARRVADDAPGALDVLGGIGSVPGGTDGGRETALLVADEVEVLADLGRLDEAREVGARSLTTSSGATTALALGRVRCVLAARVHLPAGDLETAERLAREAETDLVARGQGAQAAEAVEVLAEVAVRRGDARRAVDELRRARRLASAAQEETIRARLALAAALAGPEDRVTPAGSSGTAEMDDLMGAPDGDPLGPGPGTVPHTLAEERLDAPTPEAPGLSSPVDAALEAALDVVAAATASAWADREPARDGSPDRGSGRDRSANPAHEPAAPSSDAATAEARPGGSGDDALLGAASAGTGQSDDVLAHVATEAVPRRRRGRYRDDEEPGAALAAALAAARSEVHGAFSRASPDTGTPPDADGPGVHGVSSGPSSTDPTDPTDAAAAARSRRLALARARWESADSWPSRRGDASGGSADEQPAAAEPAAEQPAAAEPAAGEPAPADEAPRRDGEGHGDGWRGPEEVEISSPGAGDEDGSRRAPWEDGVWRGTGDELGWRAAGEHGDQRSGVDPLLGDLPWRGLGLGGGDALGGAAAPVDPSGEGLTGGTSGQPEDRRTSSPLEDDPFSWSSAGAGPDEVGAPHHGDGGLGTARRAGSHSTSEALPGLGEDRRAGENGHGARTGAAGANGRSLLPEAEPVMMGARWGEVSGPGTGGRTEQGAGPAGVDDELAEELALTLVDLLSEYQDPGVPLGTTRGPDASPAPVSGDGLRASESPPSARPARPAGSGPNGRGSSARGGRSGVPSARRADDSGPRLADLLAEAMDAYHSAGPGPGADDDRRARR